MISNRARQLLPLSFLLLAKDQIMKSKLFSCQHSRPAIHRSACRRVFRPLVELLESRLVPSTIDHSAGFASHGDLQNNGSATFTGTVARLTVGNAMEAGSIFTTAKFDITRFSTSF